MAELWEWEEAYILFQTAVMDESTAKKNKNRRKSACFHYLKLSHPEFGSFEITIAVFGTMEHLEKESRL